MLIGTWFVAFHGAKERKHLVDWLSPLWCQHVSCFAYDARGRRWLIYDVSRVGTTIVALAPVRMDMWIEAVRNEGARILQIERRDSPRMWLQVGAWCVVAVRHTVGSRSLALRPIGLWRDLLREGAKEVFRGDEL